MKIRKFFVANSSSSSFILSAKNINDFVLDIKVCLLDEFGYIAQNEQDLRYYFDEHYGKDWKYDEYSFRMFNRSMSEINAGKILFLGTVSSDSDDLASKILYGKEELLKGQKFSVIKVDD